MDHEELTILERVEAAKAELRELALLTSGIAGEQLLIAYERAELARFHLAAQEIGQETK